MPANHDSAGRPIVVVTGMGVVTSLGAGKAENWKNLTAGNSGIKNITRFATDGLKTRFAGTVDFVSAEPLSSPELSERLADLAVEEAITESGIGTKGDFPGPLFLAVPPIEIEWTQRREVAAASGANADISYTDIIRAAASGKFRPYHERFMFGSVANHLADKYGTKGSPISLSTACASGATAIQLGVEAIRRGETSAALCIGSDGSINPESLIRFSLLSALSTSSDPPAQAAKPFAKNRDGFVMAEGAGALVLESLESAKARGAKILGVMNGCGEMADAFHRTRSSPDGKPIVGCIRNALADANLKPEDIDYVNPHGTGTPENDKMEAMGVMAVFGERAKSLPMSSNKSMVGHTLSAAGAVEAVFSFLTLEHQRIPPTINYQVPDPAIPMDVVPNTARDAACAPIGFSTVQHMLFDNAKLQPGETILVQAGGSGIGTAAIKMAKAIGCTVITTVGDDDKAAKAKALGADHVINYKTERFETITRKLTNKKGVDVVFEHVGGEGFNGSLLVLKRGGRLVTCGSTAGPSITFNLMQLFQQQYKIFGSFGASMRNIRDSLDKMASGLTPVIDTELELADLERGIARLESRQVFGKIVVKF
jgi:3-oxoacyl-[acyl-carrier-protein] synthase II